MPARPLPGGEAGSEQRTGSQTLPERVRGQCQHDRRRAGQRDGGALQEPVNRQCRRGGRAARLLLVLLAGAPGVGRRPATANPAAAATGTRAGRIPVAWAAAQASGSRCSPATMSSAPAAAANQICR